MKRLEHPSDGSLGFWVRLVPRSPRNQIIGWTAEGQLKVRVAAPPVDDAANRELIAFLADSLDLPKRDVVLISGRRSRSKRLLVPETCKNRLLSFADI